ncbi:MAG: HAD hydrolase-like protein [Hyphomicrobiales bacterium]|nr:HAD hydrolase-like protein [Hyphomicrobiales bacterium]
MTARTAFFDLDGTLIDSKPGITGALRYALAEMGETVPCADDLDWVIGPPMIESLRKLVGEARAAAAQKVYRARYAEVGLAGNRVYDGMADVLQRLQAEGWALYVATSKLRAFARQIIGHLGFDRFFREVYGAEADGSLMHKTELLAHVLRETRVDPARAVMIGDRRHDVIGARANGLPTIGALWGYGGTRELEEAGAAVLARAPADVLPALATLVG